VIQKIKKIKWYIDLYDLVFLGIFIVFLILDQVSKNLIVSNIGLNNEIHYIKGFFYLTYAQNTGGAWSILDGNLLFFILSAILISLIVSYLLLTAKYKFLKLSYSLILTGAIGNLLDRLLFHYVRDFLGFYIFGYSFPVFNVADICITSGVIGLLIYYIFLEKKYKQKESSDETSSL